MGMMIESSGRSIGTASVDGGDGARPQIALGGWADLDNVAHLMTGREPEIFAPPATRGSPLRQRFKVWIPRLIATLAAALTYLAELPKPEPWSDN